MKKLKDILPQSMLFQVYKALVQSHLRYADVVWGSLSNTKISALQGMQNRGLDSIEASEVKNSLIRPTFSIDQMVQFDRSVLMFKITKYALRVHKLNLLKDPRLSKYGTRNKTDLQILRLDLDVNRNSFSYTGPKTWNSIPTHIRESNTLARFKNGLKDHFLS